MTVEEIELRKILNQMLADVGINRETLKEMVKEILNEKIKKAIEQALCETTGGVSFESKLNAFIFQKIGSWEFEREYKDNVKRIVQDAMQDFRMNIEITKKERKGEMQK